MTTTVTIGQTPINTTYTAVTGATTGVLASSGIDYIPA